MNTVRRMVWILAVNLCIGRGNCQDSYLNQDLLRLQHYAVKDGQVEALSGYNTNFVQREPNGQLSSVAAQYLPDDGYDAGEYSRAGRSRKVYRIKNPFQHKEEERSLQDTDTSQDSGTAASSQYGALQYSLPPEEFLQQMRAENQYQQQQLQQQQQQQQQYSTQLSALPYTATPQPQYQYSTLPASSYDMNQQTNQISTVEPKSFTPAYQSNTNNYQYNNQNSYNSDNIQSTPLPPYMSTSLPSNQYLGTPANNYVSSSSSLYVSSPQSSQQYVSSPQSSQQYVSSQFPNVHSGNFDYNNNRVTTVGSNSLSYDSSNDASKRMQIDHYDNAANGIRYMQGQYQNDFPSTTLSPTSTPYTEAPREFWQSSLNTGYNALPKPEQSYQTQYQNFRYNQQESRYDSDTSNSDNHRTGNLPSANNLYLNFVQPDYQLLNSLKDRARDAKTELGQPEIYSLGDYGWKLSDKKSSLEPEISTNSNFFKYQIHSVQPDTGAVSQVSFQMDSRKPYTFDQNTKPVTEKNEAEEFTKAAAKAHENYKQQLEANKYLTNNQFNNNLLANAYAFNSYHNNENQRNKLFSDHSNSQGHTQGELVTASPYFYMNSKDTIDSSYKQPFDHDKALKNIVPIDVSNVVQNSDSQAKFEIDLNNRYNFPGYNKEHSEQNFKPYSRPDPYYKDRDTIYALNLKSKLDNSLDKLKQLEQSLPYYAKSQTSESVYNNYGSNSGNSGNKHFINDSPQSSFVNQISNNHQDNTHSSANIHQQGIQRPQFSSDILKFNDIPYRLSQSLHNNNFEQSSIPTPLPVRINQNVDNHNVDITAEILAKLLSKKNMNRPEIDSQSNNFLSTINGFRVANPFNVDLKLVADMLKGKPAIDDSQMTSLRDINKPLPMKLDISQLQQLMQLKNENNMLTSSGSLGSYLDIYNSGRLPYQGVKYSRSEEDTENIPIADSSSNHPIGAVVEEDAVNEHEVSDLMENSEDTLVTNIDGERSKSIFSSNHKPLGDRQRHPSNSFINRHSYKRKYPKSELEEPYPLLKPPPRHSSRYRGPHIKEKNSHRRRVNKPKMLRVYKTEPLFESDDITHLTNLKRSLSVAEEKSDVAGDEENT